jgi:hypothetical protein
MLCPEFFGHTCGCDFDNNCLMTRVVGGDGCWVFGHGLARLNAGHDVTRM